MAKKRNKNEDDKKKTNPQPGRPLIPMKPQPGRPLIPMKPKEPTGDVLKDIEKEFGPVKYAEPEKAKKDVLSGLTHEYGTKSLLKAVLKFRK